MEWRLQNNSINYFSFTGRAQKKKHILAILHLKTSTCFATFCYQDHSLSNQWCGQTRRSFLRKIPLKMDTTLIRLPKWLHYCNQACGSEVSLDSSSWASVFGAKSVPAFPGDRWLWTTISLLAIGVKLFATVIRWECDFSATQTQIRVKKPGWTFQPSLHLRDGGKWRRFLYVLEQHVDGKTELRNESLRNEITNHYHLRINFIIGNIHKRLNGSRHQVKGQ